MKPYLILAISLLQIFALLIDPEVSYAGSGNIYGVKRFSSNSMMSTKRFSKRSFSNSSSLYGVRKTTSNSRIFGGIRNNYFSSGISSIRSGSYNDSQLVATKSKAVCYGEARSLCDSM